MKLTKQQFAAIVASAQVRFGCTEQQATRLAMSAASDYGKWPDNREVLLRFSPTGKGLVSARYVVRDKNAPEPILSTSLKLVRFLECLDAADSENIGLKTNSRVELARDMADWLMPPAADSKSAAPKAKTPKPPATTLRQARDQLHLARTQLESVYSSRPVLPQPEPRPKQEHREPIVRYISEREYFVTDLIWSRSGPNHHHSLLAECDICHRDIKITLQAPINPPKYILDEARRIVLIEHRGDEHKPKRKPAPN